MKYLLLSFLALTLSIGHGLCACAATTEEFETLTSAVSDHAHDAKSTPKMDHHDKVSSGDVLGCDAIHGCAGHSFAGVNDTTNGVVSKPPPEPQTYAVTQVAARLDSVDPGSASHVVQRWRAPPLPTPMSMKTRFLN
jgi:hypothetical protein